jgi:hypothetical protein
MKKLTAIVLLSIFTFNMVGYQLLYTYMANKSDGALELALDENNYDESQLISIKQPTNLPYYTNSKSFNRIDGEVEINGTTYKYVKCRIYNDSLEMLCIPHVEKMKIQQSKQDFAKIANDFQQDNGNKKKPGQENKSFQKSLTEFEELQQFSFDKIPALQISFVLHNTPLEKEQYFTTAEKPPNNTARA